MKIRVIPIEGLPKDADLLVSESDWLIIKNIGIKESKMTTPSVEEQNNRIFTDEKGKEYTRNELIEKHPYIDDLITWSSGPRDGSSCTVGGLNSVDHTYYYVAPEDEKGEEIKEG
jgi:hypothetical protein